MSTTTPDIAAQYPELFKPTTTASAVAPVLGMSSSSVYAAIREGTFPFPTIKVGGRIVIPTAPIREALGLNELPSNEKETA